MKGKNIGLVGMALLLGATVLSAAEGGNSRKGKYLYKNNCKDCHSEGAEGGDLTPMSKTMKQWDRYFEKDADEHPGEVMSEISEKDLKDIIQFLYDHAKDSPSPETCG